MRLYRSLPVLSLLLRARAFSLDSRQSVPHRLDVRDTPDVCANIGFYNYIGFGIIEDECTCLSTLPLFIEQNHVAASAATVLGVEHVTDILTGVINQFAAAIKCVYPEYSTPACAGSNPCGFTCIDGFSSFPTNNPTTCICSAPSVICNGQCVAPGACPSQALTTIKKKRSWVGSGSCTDIGPGWVACGILGAGPRAWECTNAARDLESCGGCMFPLTAYSPIGKDCSTLPGVADVSCMGGECIVHRCMPGYALAFDGASCIHISQPEFADLEDMPANAYGLEHVPLGWN